MREYLDIREINGYSIQFTPFHPVPPSSQPQHNNHPDQHQHQEPQQPSQLQKHPPQQHQQTQQDSALPNHPTPIRCLVYIGLPSNPQFLGPQDSDALAAKILTSRGPSGENREYLFNLEKALLDLGEGSGDEHVSDLVRRCRALEEDAEKRGEKAGVDEVAHGVGAEEEGANVGAVLLHRVGSTEEQEEVEKSVVVGGVE